MAKRTFRAEDVERLQADLNLLEKALAIVRGHGLDAMEHVEYRTGWRLMQRLYKAQGYVCQAKWALEELTPQCSLPASDMAAEIVGDWLRQQQQKKGLDESPRHEGEQGSA